MNVRLGEVCRFLNGGTPSRSVSHYFEGNIPWITGSDIISPIVTSARSYITKEAIQNSATNFVPVGTILLVTRTSVGKVAIAGIDLCFSQDITALVPLSQKIDVAYLVHFLRIQQPYFERLSRGATIKGVTREVVENLEIPLPPLPEQRRIAAILDKADAICRKRERAMARMNDFLRSVFLEMFGDPVTNPKGWEIHQLGQHIKFITSGSRGWAKYYGAKGSRFIRSLDVQMNQISDEEAVYVSAPDNAETKRTRVEPGDVLLTITGSRIGRVAAVPSDIREAYISQHVAIIRLDGTIKPRFLSMFLSDLRGGQRQISRMQYGQTKPGLNLSQIRLFEVPCPPLYEQEKFLAMWDRFNALQEKQQASVNRLSAVTDSLTYLAFRGELTNAAADDLLKQAAVG